MTPKEKAIELVKKYQENDIELNDSIDGDYYGRMNNTDAKQCALIAVEEIAKCTKYENQKFENDRFSEEYWQEVKQEIEAL
jgi:hypothetical protein